MDYQKLLPALAITLGLSASAAQSFAADQNNALFGMSEVNGHGLLIAREKGCAAEKGCLGVCAGRKTLHKKDKDASKSCNGEKNCAGSKDGSKSCSGDKHCNGKKDGAKSCSGEKSCKGAKSESTCAGKKSSAMDSTCASKR